MAGTPPAGWAPAQGATATAADAPPGWEEAAPAQPPAQAAPRAAAAAAPAAGGAAPPPGWGATAPTAKAAPTAAPGAGKPPTDVAEPTLNFAHFKSKYAQALDAQAQRLNLDPKLLRAVHYVEDASEDPAVISDAGAIGEMQMKPGTFKQFAAKGANITDPVANIDAGAMALSYYMHKYGGDVDRAVSAYAQGEGFADAGQFDRDYLAKFHAIYKSLTAEIPGPGNPANPPLTKGGKPAPKTTAAPAVEHGTLTAPAGGAVGAVAEYAGVWTENALRQAWSNISDTFTDNPEQKAALQMIGKLPPVEGVATGTRIFGDLVMLPLSGLDAVMRDVATGRSENIGDLGSRIFSALKDPVHAGDFLDQLTEKYGPFLRAENLWWAQQPGIRESLAKAGPKTPLGQAFQAELGLRADVGRYLLNKNFVSGGLGFLTGMVAPVGAEMALVRGAGRVTGQVLNATVVRPLAKAGVKLAPQTAVKVGAYIVNLGAHIDAAKAKVLSTAPIVGDRYHQVYRQLGDKGANQQRKYVKDQAESHYSAHSVLGQEDKLGGSQRSDRLDVHREADRFFNPHTTLHVVQPQGGQPHFDPITGTTTMVKGPAWGPQVSARQVVYAQHPAPNLPGEPAGSPTIAQGQEAHTIFAGDPVKVANFNALVKKGDVRGALRMLPGIAQQDVDATAQLIDNATAAIKGKRAKAKLVRDLVNKKAVGHWLASTGRQAAEIDTVNGIQVIVPRKIEALERDDRMVGNVSVHDRAVNTMHVLHAADDTTRALAPSLGGRLIDGYFPRGGMFATEKTLLEKLEGPGASLESKGGTAGAAPGATQKREYGSIEHALGNGEQINPTFDSAEAAERSLSRSIRFQNYMRYVLDAARQTSDGAIQHGLIDYDAALQAAIHSGRLKMPMTFAKGVPQLGRGPAGRKAFEKWVAEEATEQLANGPGKLTPQQLADTTDQHILDVRSKAQDAIHTPVQDQFEADHPDLMWQADQQLGVEDLAGLTLPKVVRDAAIDGHPVLAQAAGTAPTGAWALRDAPENWAADAFETTMNGFRTVFLANILYHPFRNLARLGFGFGYLNPDELAQGLYAPHTIDDALLQEAEEMGALSRRFSLGAVGPRTSARYAYADPVTHARTPKGIIGDRGAPLGLGLVKDAATSAGRSRLGQRIRTALEGYRNVASDSNHGPLGPANAAMHVLGKAMYNADRWNTDWTFGVWEDALAAQTYGKLRDRGIASGMKADEARAAAANEVRRIMGDTGNLTPMERQLGLARTNWFYAWTKGQWRLWSRIMSDPRAAQFFTAQTYGVRAGNEATALPDPQDYPEDLVWGYDGDKPLALRVGGGYLSKAEGIADLATAPLTNGQGLLDFGDAVADDAFNTLNPAMRLIFVNMGQTFGYPKGQEPSPWGTIMDRDLPGPDMVKQAGQQLTKRVAPSELATFQKAVKDRNPVYLMDLLGIRVKDLNEAQEARVHGIVEGKFRKILDESLRLATSNEQREMLKQAYGPLIEQEENTRMELQGY